MTTFKNVSDWPVPVTREQGQILPGETVDLSEAEQNSLLQTRRAIANGRLVPVKAAKGRKAVTETNVKR